MTEEMLLDAIELAHEGRNTEARWLLQEILKVDRANETAWLWLADCSETPSEGIAALETCLRHNPNAVRVRARLEMLQGHGQPTARLVADELTENISVPKTVFKPPEGEEYLEDFIEEKFPEPEEQTGIWETAEQATWEKPVEPVPFETQAQASILSQPIPEMGSSAAPATRMEVEEPFYPQEPESFSEEDAWHVSLGALVFTVPPEAVPDEEFIAIEERTEKFLASRPDTLPRRQGEDDWGEIRWTTGRSLRRQTESQAASWNKRAMGIAALMLYSLMLAAALLVLGLVIMRGM